MILTQINDACSFIKSKTDFIPQIGIILGTGLGKLANEIELKHSINYSNIPHFVTSTVESHQGKLLLGTLNGKNVIAMQGRFHYYEGYDMKQVTFPVRVLKSLGIINIFISNACGCLNPNYKKGELMIINDHINLFPENPLRGRNYNELGPRFPDMSKPYNPNLITKANEIAKSLKIKVHNGVYVGVPGPNLESKAEYVFLRKIGADVVGMSTIPEVIVANHAGLSVFSISVITDECYHEILNEVSVEEIIAVANKAEPNMTSILKEMILQC